MCKYISGLTVHVAGNHRFHPLLATSPRSNPDLHLDVADLMHLDNALATLLTKMLPIDSEEGRIWQHRKLTSPYDRVYVAG